MTKILAACFWQAYFWYTTSKHYLYRVVLYSSMTPMGDRIVCRTDISTYYIQRREQQHSPAVVSYYTHMIEGKKQDVAEHLCCMYDYPFKLILGTTPRVCSPGLGRAHCLFVS